MALQLRRPILIGGLGLTIGAWVFNSLDPGMTHYADTAVWGIAALGSGIWLLKQRTKSILKLNVSPPVDRSIAEKAIAEVAARINQLEQESQTGFEQNTPALAELVSRLRQQLTELTTELDRQDIRLAITGGKAVGKTTLVQLLKQPPSSGASLSVQKTAPLSIQNATSASAAATTSHENKLQETETADLVLFVTIGDLRESEFRAIEQLIKQGHRLLVVFNKQDQYLPDERPLVLQQLRERLQGLLPIEDIVAVSAQPAPVIVRQQQSDGSVQERLEQPAPDIAPLQERLTAILTQQGQQLVLSTVVRQARALNASVQAELNRYRRDRAMPIIEQYQWIAGAASFANPVPSLDLIATASVTAQLVVELGALYQQKFSLDQAKTVMGSLVEQMVKLGLVEMASQAIAPLLKSHALTYVAGGTVQGLSAAYLIRIAGLTLVEYFEEQSLNLNATATSPFQLDRLIQKLKRVFQENQRSAFLQSLVKQGIGRLLPQTKDPVIQVKDTTEAKVYAD